MRRRAKAALIPTWPQVRTFTRAEAEQNERDSDAWMRGETDHLGPIAEWVNDIQHRTPKDVRLEVLVDGLPPHPLERAPLRDFTITIRPQEDQ